MTREEKFRRTLDEYQRLEAAGGAQTQEALRLWIEVCDNAPPLFLQALEEVAKKHLPAPNGYTTDGEPLYELEKIAQHLGADVDTVPEELLERAYTGKVHRVN